MGDMGDIFNEERRRRQEAGRQRRIRATNEFPTAQRQAIALGFRLSRRNETHYTLTPAKETKGWLYNIYPGKCRIYADPNRRGPFLKLPDEWTLIDVVKAAANVQRLMNRKIEALRSRFE